MTAKEFFYKVAQLRDTQKMFFETGHPDYLKKRKQLEKEIDDEIERVKQLENRRANPTLF